MGDAVPTRGDLLGVFFVASTPIGAYLDARAICRVEALSKTWFEAVRALPGDLLWADLFRGAFPAVAKVLLPLMGPSPAGEPLPRRACRQLAAAGDPPGDRAVECEWTDGGRSFAPRDADSFALLLTAGPYAGLARWGGPTEFTRESDPEEYEHLAVWESPRDEPWVFDKLTLPELTQGTYIERCESIAARVPTSCFLVDLTTFVVRPLWRHGLPPEHGVTTTRDGRIVTGNHGVSAYFVGVTHPRGQPSYARRAPPNELENKPGVYAVKGVCYTSFVHQTPNARLRTRSTFKSRFLILERVTVNFAPAARAYRGRGHLQRLLCGLLDDAADVDRLRAAGSRSLAPRLDGLSLSPDSGSEADGDDEVATLRRLLRRAERSNARLRAATSYLAEAAYLGDTLEPSSDSDINGHAGHHGDSSDEHMSDASD